MKHLREGLCRLDHARAGHHENIRRDGEHAMLLHGGEIRDTIPQRDDAALMFLGDADRIRHIAHVDDHLGVARHHFFERNLGITGQRVAEYIFSAGDFDDFVQVRRAAGHHQAIQAVGRSPDDEHHAYAREPRHAIANFSEAGADRVDQLRGCMLRSGGGADVVNGLIDRGDVVLVDFENVQLAICQAGRLDERDWFG